MLLHAACSMWHVEGCCFQIEMPNALDDRAVCGIIKLATCHSQHWMPHDDDEAETGNPQQIVDLLAALPPGCTDCQRPAAVRAKLRRGWTDCITGQPSG